MKRMSRPSHKNEIERREGVLRQVVKKERWSGIVCGPIEFTSGGRKIKGE